MSGPRQSPTPEISAIVFLGNPGSQYSKTRHNAAWQVCDAWRTGQSWEKKFSSLWSKTSVGGKDVLLQKPETYMNNSGRAVQALLQFFKIPLQSCLVVHDDLELPFGTVGFQAGGGLQGHNGLKSIAGSCGGPGFLRLRIGIGRPVHGSVSSFVLSRFSREEEIQFPLVVETSRKLLEDLLGGSVKLEGSGRIKREI
ncbi:aminoacyl-tRNA hydrolase [Spirochaeta lutea]|uniref:aminoacyl-tRNA hydrolase n=1 Tax=Spirochaeta lutea TaxID=1480694 RepID=UPI0006893A11|nr:aminoacyl-tRNA hydrolase [Spirochaeta lutea]